MSKDHILHFWENQGRTHGDSHWASWGDNYAIDLEIETIGKQIKDGDCVLDIGCANGYSTIRQFQSHNLCSITGMDFAESMIEAANLKKQKMHLGNKIRFTVGDVRSMKFPENSFDVVYTTRVLINLPTWDEQKQAIMECLRLVKLGGKLILSEGFWEPLVLLNALRTLKNMPPLVEHDYNRYLKRSSVEQFLSELKVENEFDDFSSIYYLGSRFLRELVTDPLAYPGFSNPINKIFYELERTFSGGGMGIQQAVIIRKDQNLESRITSA